ncbi:MAG TPA: DUF262 domain-containing protein [Ignavibacteria bacterium]|nr:DUF262 domain-containing protein [Ignavibacteria bacterium]
MKLNRTNKTIDELVRMFADKEIAIPEIQRDFVWRSDKIKKLLDSIQRDYPSGAIVLWDTIGMKKSIRELYIRPERLHLYQKTPPRYLLIDGQQRLTSLLSVILPSDVVNNKLGEEIKLPTIIINKKTLLVEARKDLKNLSHNEILINEILNDDTQIKISTQLNKYKRNILNYSYPVQIIETDNYTDVANVFKRINKQGKTLITAEIELANIIPYWNGISEEFRNFIRRMRKEGFIIDLPLIMRCLASVANNSAKIDDFTKRVMNNAFLKNQLITFWKKTKTSFISLNGIFEKYLIDRTELITTRNALVPIIYTLSKIKKNQLDEFIFVKYLLFSMISGHYSEQSETVLRKDFYSLTNERLTINKRFIKLFNNIKNNEFKRSFITEKDLEGVYSKNPYLLLMYLAFRLKGASDFDVFNTELSKVGKIHLHHIFPYDFLIKDKEYQKNAKKRRLNESEIRMEINDIANITFVSIESNERIKSNSPKNYLTTESKNNLIAHCIPQNTKLWDSENYRKFLKERKKLIIKSVNKYLNNF